MDKNMEKFNAWLQHQGIEKSLLFELTELKKKLESGDAMAKEAAEEEINDRFYRELEFGTGGLRGILGAGTNRMNIYTVKKATQGVAAYILAHYSDPRCSVSYDSRINSKLFAEVVAETLLASGIDVYLYDTLMPAPALSFATRYHRCAIGIMITASHNPAAYNGYKVYNEDGCQVTNEAAAEILDYINHTEFFAEPAHQDGAKLIYMKEETKNAFYQAVEAEKMHWGSESAMKKDMGGLSVVYTPLNGAGNVPVREVLSRLGVGKVHIVQEQELPDGNFPTCPYPNPEKKEALEKGLALCRSVEPDLLMATDPDCDRVGIAVNSEGDYVLLTGNETGILLFDFICRMRSASQDGTGMPPRPVLVRTIVSSKLPDLIAKDYGVEVMATLTGFKFIGEYIKKLEAEGRERDYIFGFEESYGYLSGTYVRDKDAVNASMLICQMTAFYKKEGKTLAQRLTEIYDQYGYFINDLMEFAFEGAKGMVKMSEIMETLRTTPPTSVAGLAVTAVTDYMIPAGLPKADVLEFMLEGGSSFVVRPSGTEPKLKIYLSAKSGTRELAASVIEALKKEITGQIFVN